MAIFHATLTSSTGRILPTRSTGETRAEAYDFLKNEFPMCEVKILAELVYRKIKNTDYKRFDEDRM